MQENNIRNINRQSWEIENVFISHHVIDYDGPGVSVSKNDSELVRLHFGLKGSYAFRFAQLNADYDLSGHHNNLMYTDGFEIEVRNKTNTIETFGINFSTSAFVNIAQNGNGLLQRFAEQVIEKKNSILSNDWKTNSLRIREIIDEIIHCPYSEGLKDLFLMSKSIELLVAQAEMYGKKSNAQFVKTRADKEKLIAAKELILERVCNPPSIKELARLVALNDFKLKGGFKELFGTTVFGFIHRNRIHLAKRLLLNSDKSAQEIDYEIGYSSPQHFSMAFRKEFGVTPRSIRKTPDLSTD